MIEIYGKPQCPFCDKAKHLLTTKDIAFEVVNIEEQPEAREWLMAQGHRSVPQLYLGDKLFVEGGYQGLAKLSDEEINERLGESDVSNA